MSVAIEIIPYRLPLRRPWRTARGDYHHRQGWLICAQEAGLTGYGDCAPLPEAGTEDLASAASRLASWQHRAEGAAATINSLLDQLQDEQIPPLMPRPKTGKVLAPHPQGQQAAIADPEHGIPPTEFSTQLRCPAADMAIETALLDLQARLQGVPLHQGLQHTADPLHHASAADSQARAVTTTIAVNAAMGDATALDPDRLRQLIDDGWRVFKFKVGVADFTRELKQLEIAASLLPTDGRLRLDANGAWTEAQAAYAIEALNPFPIDTLEEPLQDPDPAILAALQDQARFALALDESLTRWSTQSPMPEPANLPVRRLVLKPGVIGGLRPCLQLARAAKAAGKEVVITSLIESAAGLWASAQLCAATHTSDRSTLAHGLATSDWLARDLGPPPPISGGQLRLGNQPGSGFRLHTHAAIPCLLSHPDYSRMALVTDLDRNTSQCLRQKAHPGNPDPRVLLLHGFTGDRHDWDWWPQARLPALATDLPGHGASPDPVGTYDEAIEHLLALLPPSIDRLVGYSLGGRIALSLIAKAPARFRVACILSSHPGLENVSARAARKITDRDWIQLLETQGLETFVQAWEAQPLFASQQRLDPTLIAAQRATRLSHRAQGLAASLRCFGLGEMPPTWDAIRKWPGRLHWLVGGEDHKFSALASDLQARRPQTQLCELPGIGHNPLLEAPKQARSFCLDAMHTI